MMNIRGKYHSNPSTTYSDIVIQNKCQWTTGSIMGICWGVGPATFSKVTLFSVAEVFCGLPQSFEGDD